MGWGRETSHANFLRCVRLWTGASEYEDDGPDDEVDMRGKEGKWIWGGRGDEDFRWQVILRGMRIILLEISKARWSGVEFRSRISGSSTRM